MSTDCITYSAKSVKKYQRGYSLDAVHEEAQLPVEINLRQCNILKYNEKTVSFLQKSILAPSRLERRRRKNCITMGSTLAANVAMVVTKIWFLYTKSNI